MLIRKIAAILLGALSLNLAVAATFQIPEASLTLELAPGWIQIPSEVLAEAQREVKKQAPAASAVNYNYAFQFGSRDTWFSYPYVLVEIKRTGRIPGSKIKELETLSSKELSGTVSEKIRNIATEVEVGKMRYDENTKTIWINTGSNVAGVGRVSGITAIYPTEYGSVSLHGYAREEQHFGFVTTFYELVSNSRLSDDAKYKPRATDNLGFLNSIDWGSTGSAAVIGAAIAAISYLSRRRKSKNDRPTGTAE